MSVVAGSLILMTTVFGSDSAQLTALDAVMTRAEALEREARRIEAERLRVFADAVDVALAEIADLRVTAAPAQGSRDDRSERAREAARSELAYRAVRAELATVFRLGETAVERKMDHAYRLAHHYSDVFDALLDGRLGEQHTRVVVEAGLVIGGDDSFECAERRLAYEQAVLPFACEETPNRLRPIAARLAEQFAEIPFDARHEQAKSRRRVFVVDGDDGMSDLVAHLPAVEAHAIHERLTAMAREVERCEAVPDRGPDTATSAGTEPVRRRCDEIRADLLSDLLLSNIPTTTGECADTGLGGVRARLQVIVTDDSLFAGGEGGAASHRAAPAELSGVGPLDAATARRLARAADHWELIRCEPSTGEVVSVNRYRPSAQMRRLLGVRDEHCRFPGCRAPIWRCDLDHTIDAAKGGATATDNLAHLCRGHHMLKHHGGWRAEQEPGGVLRWLSPSGRVYRDRPASRVRFAKIRTTARYRE